LWKEIGELLLQDCLGDGVASLVILQAEVVGAFHLLYSKEYRCLEHPLAKLGSDLFFSLGRKRKFQFHTPRISYT